MRHSYTDAGWTPDDGIADTVRPVGDPMEYPRLVCGMADDRQAAALATAGYRDLQWQLAGYALGCLTLAAALAAIAW
jgi:hypothetical protein